MGLELGLLKTINPTMMSSRSLPVPPDSVVIFDESGSPRTTFVGPYEEAATINLICDAFGGKLETLHSTACTQRMY